MFLKSEDITVDIATEKVVDGGALSDLYSVQTLIPTEYVMKSGDGSLGSFNTEYDPLADLLLGPVGAQLTADVVIVEERPFRQVTFNISAPFIQHFVNDLKLVEGAYVESDYVKTIED